MYIFYTDTLPLGSFTLTRTFSDVVSQSSLVIGWKIRVGKWMKNIGLVGEKIQDQKIDVKNSGRKIDGKNGTSR